MHCTCSLLCTQRELTGAADLEQVTSMEIIVDTTESSLGKLGSLVPNVQQLKLSNSIVVSIRYEPW